MGIGECPKPDPDCKYFDRPPRIEDIDVGCFSDTHHIFGRPKKTLEKRFASLAMNKVQICRAEHEEIHATTGILELPDRNTMMNVVMRKEPLIFEIRGLDDGSTPIP